MGNDKVAITAAFLSGLYVLQTLNFCWTGSFPTLLKFGIAPSKIGLFIGDTGSSMNYWVSWGILLSYGLSFCGWTGNNAFIAPSISTVIFCLAFAYACRVKKFIWWKALVLFLFVLVPIIVVLFAIGSNDYQGSEYGKFVCPIVSCFSSISTFITNSIIFHVVVFGHGNEGVRKLYFWLCMSALAYQFDSCMTAKVGGPQVAWYFFAMELSYFVIPFIHRTCERIHKALGVHDLNFFTVFWHVFAICIFTLMSLEMWIVNVYLNWDTYSSTSADMNPAASLLRCLSPFFLGIIGMGSIFWLFPVVWPFMVCHYSHFRFVMLLGPGLGSFATLIPWVLSDGDKIGINDVKLKTKFDIWSIGELKGGAYYHFLWLLIVLIFALFGIHMCCIHYPRCFVARTVLHSRWAVVCGSLFFFFTQSAKAWGLNGCFANAIGSFFLTSGFSGGPLSFVSGSGATISIGQTAGEVGITNFQFSNSEQTFSVDIPKRKLTGTNVYLMGTPKIQFFGILGVMVSTLEISGSSSSGSGTFTGDANDTITLSGTLNLSSITAKAGGANASLIHTLTKIEIKGLALTSSQLTVTPSSGSPKTVEKMDITLVFSSAIVVGFDSGNRMFSLPTGANKLNTDECKVVLYESSGNLIAVTAKITAGQFNTTPGTNNEVIINSSNGNVEIKQFNFDTGSPLTISVTGGSVTISRSGTVQADQSAAKVILYGVKLGTKEVSTLPIEGSSINSSGATEPRLNTSSSQPPKLELKTGTSNQLNFNAQAQGGKLGTFIPPAGNFSAADFLTKMVISGISVQSGTPLSIDGIPVGGVAMTLAFAGGGIAGTGSNKSFTVQNNSQLDTSSCEISIPFDFAHGPAFGNVSFSFSLLHLTAALFTAQAYSVGVGSFKCAVDSGCLWPTQGLGGFRSFFWWLGYGLKNGNRRFWSLLSVDIVSAIS